MSQALLRPLPEPAAPSALGGSAVAVAGRIQEGELPSTPTSLSPGAFTRSVPFRNESPCDMYWFGRQKHKVPRPASPNAWGESGTGVLSDLAFR